MGEWVLPVLVTALFSVSGSYFIFSRKSMTKKEHTDICQAQQAVTTVQFKALDDKVGVVAKDVGEVKADVKTLTKHLLNKGGG